MTSNLRRALAACAAVGLVTLMGCGGGGEQGQAGGEMGENENEMAANQAQEQAAESSMAMQQGGQQMQLPDDVTEEMVSQGREIFHGNGLCYTCHGQDGKGMPNLGADLTDSKWVHNDGSYQGIVGTIQSGVTAEQSTSGTPMPPKGGSNISDDQVNAVAAYVWSLSHGGKA